MTTNVVSARPTRRRLLPVAAAVTWGALLGALGTLLGWSAAEPLPRPDQVTAAVRAGLPGASTVEVGWHDAVTDTHFVTDPARWRQPGQQQATAGGGAVTPAAFDAARGRLAAAGFEVRPGPGTMEFTADRGDLRTRWSFRLDDPTRDLTDGTADIWAWQPTPAPVYALTAAGWLLGAALGAWFAARPRLRTACIVATWLLALPAAWTIVTTVHLVLSGQPGDVAPWPAYLIPAG